MMSHAAIVCREYGLPAVTGTGSASTTIKTGQRLRVDGSTGRGDDPVLRAIADGGRLSRRLAKREPEMLTRSDTDQPIRCRLARRRALSQGAQERHAYPDLLRLRAQATEEATSEADEDIVSLAILLHDIGWWSIDMADILEKGFGPNMMQSDVRFLHEQEGVRLSREVLANTGWAEQ